MSITSRFLVLPRPCSLLFTLGFLAAPGRADEIRLKDGKKLYGVIVAYEDNMFKVKTDYGYVLVEKSQDRANSPQHARRSRSAQSNLPQSPPTRHRRRSLP